MHLIPVDGSAPAPEREKFRMKYTTRPATAAINQYGSRRQVKNSLFSFFIALCFQSNVIILYHIASVFYASFQPIEPKWAFLYVHVYTCPKFYSFTLKLLQSSKIHLIPRNRYFFQMAHHFCKLINVHRKCLYSLSRICGTMFSFKPSTSLCTHAFMAYSYQLYMHHSIHLLR